MISESKLADSSLLICSMEAFKLSCGVPSCKSSKTEGLDKSFFSSDMVSVLINCLKLSN